jgi:hypothetical protein
VEDAVVEPVDDVEVDVVLVVVTSVLVEVEDTLVELGGNVELVVVVLVVDRVVELTVVDDPEVIVVEETEVDVVVAVE